MNEKHEDKTFPNKFRTIDRYRYSNDIANRNNTKSGGNLVKENLKWITNSYSLTILHYFQIGTRDTAEKYIFIRKWHYFYNDNRIIDKIFYVKFLIQFLKH